MDFVLFPLFAELGAPIELALIFVLGIGAQWIAWRLKVPSILLLLVFGFLAGPVSHALGYQLLNPDKLFTTDLLFPIVSISVAIILLEGGLTLELSELRQAGVAITGLVTVGAAVTWAMTAAAAYYVLDAGLEVSLILGAMLVVTGPTVIGPLLRQIRPIGRVGVVAKWEGLVIDPIGAMLGVLAFVAIESFYKAGGSGALGHSAIEFVRTIAIGMALGALAAWPLLFVLRRYWIPDYLQSPVLLTVAIGCFVASNSFAHESGLFAVTLMGLILANQKQVQVKHIIEFKENLRVLLISWLFIVLAARIRLEQFDLFNWRSFAFVAMLMLVIRPVAVFLSTIGSKLTRNERIFIAWLAPRGIVAAALASIFALRLADIRQVPAESAAIIEPITFLVIVMTVTIYGLTAAPLARKLGLASGEPQGVLFAGAHAAVRAIAHALQNAGFQVLLVDSNRYNAQIARLEGLPTTYASILSEHAIEELEMGGLGRFVGFTRNDEVNSLAAMHFREAFGQAEVYRLTPENRESDRQDIASELVHGRPVFAEDLTYRDIDARFAAGAIVKATGLSEEFSMENFVERYGEATRLLFVVRDGKLLVNTLARPLSPDSGDTVIALVDPPEDELADEAAAGNG